MIVSKLGTAKQRYETSDDLGPALPNASSDCELRRSIVIFDHSRDGAQVHHAHVGWAMPVRTGRPEGGGSHGAFTWGVLDRLLEEEALHFESLLERVPARSTPSCSPMGWRRETRPQWRSEVGASCCDYTKRRFLATLQTTGLLLGVRSG